MAAFIEICSFDPTFFLCAVDSEVHQGAVAAKVRNNHDANMLLKNHTLKLSFFCLVFSLAATSALCKTRTSPIAALLLVGEGSLVS